MPYLALATSVLLPAFASTAPAPRPGPAHSRCAQIRWSAARSPSACWSPVISGACSHCRRHRQSALRNQFHGALDRNPDLALRLHRPSCSCPAADLRARADRLHPGCRRRSATAAWETAAVSSAILFCISGLLGRLPSWRISTVFVHLLLGPSSLVHVRVDHLADAVAEQPPSPRQRCPAR